MWALETRSYKFGLNLVLPVLFRASFSILVIGMILDVSFPPVDTTSPTYILSSGRFLRIPWWVVPVIPSCHGMRPFSPNLTPTPLCLDLGGLLWKGDADGTTLAISRALWEILMLPGGCPLSFSQCPRPSENSGNCSFRVSERALFGEGRDMMASFAEIKFLLQDWIAWHTLG